MSAISSDAQSLPVGARVRVNVYHADFFRFTKTETGTVIRSAPGYLKTIVEFDKPIPYIDWQDNEQLKLDHNFNPDQLVLLETQTMFTIGQKVTRKALPDTFGRNNEPIPNLTVIQLYTTNINGKDIDYLTAQLPDHGTISAPVSYFEAQEDGPQ